MPLVVIRNSKTIMAITFALLLLIGTVVSGLCLTKKIEISDNGAILNISTFGGTVGEILKDNGVALLSQDNVTPALDTKVNSAMHITITRAMPISFTYQGTVSTVWTTAHTVKDMLDKAGITLDEKDVVNPALDSVLEKDASVVITKVSEDMVTINEEIPFSTVTRPSYNLERGKKKVAVEGVSGIKELVYKVVTHDGVENSRELVGESVVKKPVNCIVEVGVMGKKPAGERVGNLASRGDLRYRTALTCVATAYDIAGGGKSPSHPAYGITASGMTVRRGVVAVDPRLIPLGTKLFIESADGKVNYGYAIAADTGGAIKGNRIDLYMDSRSEALQWGRRQVTVYILDN